MLKNSTVLIPIFVSIQTGVVFLLCYSLKSFPVRETILSYGFIEQVVNVFGNEINGTYIPMMVRRYDDSRLPIPNQPICDENICFRKCCPLDDSLTYFPEYRSINFNNDGNIKMDNEVVCAYNNDNLKINDIPFINNNNLNFDKLKLFTGFPCETKYIYEVKNFKMSHLGNLIYYDWTGKIINSDLSSYCIDLFVYKNVKYTKAYNCVYNEVYYRTFVRISVVSFLLIFFVYAILPELRNSTYGLCLISHSSSLNIAYSTIVMKPYSLFLIQRRESLFTPSDRYYLGRLYYVSFYAGFFWMNVICYDIWYNIWSMLPKTEKKVDVKRFLKYTAYVWCTATLFVLVDKVIAGGIIPTDPDECFILGYKEQKCTYFYVPIGVTLIVNLFFFAHTAYIIKQTMDKSNPTGHEADENPIYERYSVYLKLFIVTGVSYILEIISFLNADISSDRLRNLTDLVNSLRGLFMLIIFVMKKRTLMLLFNKFCCCRRFKLRIRSASFIRSQKCLENQDSPRVIPLTVINQKIKNNPQYSKFNNENIEMGVQ